MPSHAAVVTEIEELAPSVLQITIAFADDTFRFQPGQCDRRSPRTGAPGIQAAFRAPHPRRGRAARLVP